MINSDKKIGIFIRSLERGGAEKQAILLSHILSNSNQSVLIILNKQGELINHAYTLLQEDSIFFINGKSFFSKAIHLYKLFKILKLDILVCFLPSNNILGIIIGKLSGIPKIYGGLRGTKIKNDKFKMAVQRFLMNNLSTKIVSNSFAAKESYSKYGVKKGKIVVIHNSLDVKRDYYRRYPNEVIKIISVGRFVEEKDYITALRSIKVLSKRIANKECFSIRYIIVGYGTLEMDIRKKVRDLGLSEIVQIIIKPENLENYYMNSDIFLITSVNEGMPNTVMEAMAWSLPIVATNAGDTSYLVQEGISGFICPIGCADKIAEKLEILVKSSEKRNEFGKQGYLFLKSRFSTQKMLTSYLTLFNENINGSKI